MNAPRLTLSVDDDKPLRRRRQVAVPQAAIARAVRVASEAGPTWRAAIDGDVIHLFQGVPLGTAVTSEAIAPEKAWRL
jgi:hypothetical protein